MAVSDQYLVLVGGDNGQSASDCTMTLYLFDSLKSKGYKEKKGLLNRARCRPSVSFAMNKGETMIVYGGWNGPDLRQFLNSAEIIDIEKGTHLQMLNLSPFNMVIDPYLGRFDIFFNPDANPLTETCPLYIVYSIQANLTSQRSI